MLKAQTLFTHSMFTVFAAAFCLTSSHAVVASESATFAEQIVELVNIERWNNGQLAPLKSNGLLDQSAILHSQNMAERDFFSHCDLDTGLFPWDRMQDAGYIYNRAGENIAAGYGSAQSVMTGWMNSPGHRANILSGNFREIGVGYFNQADDQNSVRSDGGNCTDAGTVSGPYSRYWTQNFGTRSSVYPMMVNREAHQTNNRHVDLYVYGEGWANQIRLRNENHAWSEWMSFTPDVSWTLSTMIGEKSVFAELKNATSTRQVQDTIWLAGTLDLSVVVQDSVDPVLPGGNFTYSIYVTNESATEATGVMVENVLPIGLSIATLPQECSVMQQLVSCNLGTIAPALVKTIDIPVSVASSAGNNTLNNSVTVSADQGETVITNNSDFEQTLIAMAADSDGDGINDDLDNCSLEPNTNQLDTDNDGFGNMCDGDFDNDFSTNTADLTYFKNKFFSSDVHADFNGDGRVNTFDLTIFKKMFFKSPGPSGLAQ